MDIKNNTIIICESSYKRKILEYLTNEKKFLNVKIISKSDFFSEYLFKYDNNTLLYLMNKYNIKLSIAKMYLKNLFFIKDNIDYNNEKLKFLSDLKKDLDNKKLLIYNDKYKDIIKNYNIKVIGYPYLYNYELEIFKEINADIINEFNNYENNNVYEFNSTFEEVNFVIKSICKLILNGVSINDIKLVNVDSTYYNYLRRLAITYNIPIYIPNNNSLYNNIIGKKFLDNFNGNFSESLDIIKDSDEEIVNKIINICNKYVGINDNNIKELLIDDFKNTKINNFNLKNYLEIKDINDDLENCYVFLINFNNKSIPNYLKDEDYITDNIKDIIRERKTNELNNDIKNYTINKIKSIKNLVITYKNKDTNGECYPSVLIEYMHLNIIKYDNNILESYSLLNDKIDFAKCLDNYNFYGTVTNDLEIYENNLSIPYNTYNNNFKGVNNKTLKEYLNNSLHLSYTSLNSYRECAFKYYLKNILKIDKFEDTFEAFIGSLFHYILSISIDNKIDIDEEINNYINESSYELNTKEKFFINIIKDDIKFVVGALNKQKEYTEFNNSLYEKKICIDKTQLDMQIEFNGIIDKILYKEINDKTLVSVIDYKTGYTLIDLRNVLNGLGMQLPIYLYLIVKSKIFNNPLVVGFYLQHILNKNIKIDNKKSLEEQKLDNLKLMGYSLNDPNFLEQFDNSYTNSNLIKSLKTKKDGEFYNYSNVLSQSEIENLVNITDKIIDDTINDIISGKFDINPKIIDNKDDISCKYCKFKDVCFKKDSNYIFLDKQKDLSFLGGVES